MAMNALRLSGDLLHQTSILILLYLIAWKQNGLGISRKSQELYLLVFATRYLDIFTSFYSIYNTVAKIYYLATTGYVVFALHCKEPVRSTYPATQDQQETVAHSQTIPVLFANAFVIHCLGSGAGGFNMLELLWTFSILCETVAIVPQLLLFRSNRHVSRTVRWMIGCRGAYRFLYILNWVYRAHHEPHYRHHFLVYFCGVLQVILYADFWGFICREQWHHMCDQTASSTTTEMTGDDVNGQEESATKRELEEPLLASAREPQEITETTGGVAQIIVEGDDEEEQIMVV